MAHPGGSSTRLPEWLQEHRVTFVKIGNLAVGGKVAILKAAEPTRGVEGSKLLWALRYVHAWLGLQGYWSKSFAWLSDNFGRWVQSLRNKYDVGPLHMRKAQSRKHNDHHYNQAAGWEAAGSLLETTCSTFALVLLLSNWSHSSSKALAEGSGRLLTKWLGDAFQVILFMRAERWTPSPVLTFYATLLYHVFEHSHNSFLFCQVPCVITICLAVDAPFRPG